MGLEKEIEKIFKRAMESDLDLIAQDASADTTPQGSCMCACGIIATVTSPDTRLDDQLYSIEKIAFRPLKNFWEIAEERIHGGHDQHPGPHSESLEELLEKWRNEKRVGAVFAIENQIASLITVLAEHFRDEGPSVTIVPRLDGKVVSLGVLDFVRLDCTEDDLEKLVESNQLHLPSIGPLDRWPEEISIAEKDGTTEHYRRADIAIGIDKDAPMAKSLKAVSARKPASKDAFKIRQNLKDLKDVHRRVDTRRPKIQARRKAATNGTDGRKLVHPIFKRILGRGSESPRIRSLEANVGQIILQSGNEELINKLREWGARG
jgi:hypothetical protein